MNKKVNLVSKKTGKTLKQTEVIELGIKTNETLKTDAKNVKTCTINKDGAGRYFASFCYERELVIVRNKSTKTVGIDLGIKTFATLAYDSKNQRVYEKHADRSKEIKLLQKNRDILNKKISTKKKGSSKFLKLKKSLNRTYNRISNIKHDFIHKETTKIAKRFSTICIEDLSCANMMKNHNLAESLARENFYEFRKMLEYKAELYGSRLIIADKSFPSTQKCSHCWNRLIGKDKLNLSNRQYICPICGFTEDRDNNAAYNLKMYAELQR